MRTIIASKSPFLRYSTANSTSHNNPFERSFMNGYQKPSFFDQLIMLLAGLSFGVLFFHGLHYLAIIQKPLIGLALTLSAVIGLFAVYSVQQRSRFPSVRSCFLVIFIACCALIDTAFFMQNHMLLEPCYMCILQRIFLMGAGLVALLAALHNPKKLGYQIYSVLVVVMALGGGYFSGKQVWLQSLPEGHPYIPDCGATVSYLFNVENFFTALGKLLHGDGTCADVQWTFLGLSIAGWMLVCFLVITLFALWQMRRDPTAQKN